MKRSKKYYSSSNDGNGISDETSTTRLFADDLAEVKSLCVDGKTKSDVIRELVRRALYARRYRQASTDPAFKEILKAFDDRMGVRLHHLEERLNNRLEADRQTAEAVLGYLYFAAFFGVEELKQIRLLVTHEDVSDEEYLAAWDKRFQAVREAAARNIRAQEEARRKRLEPEGDGRGGGVSAGGGDD